MRRSARRTFHFTEKHAGYMQGDIQADLGRLLKQDR